MSTDSMTWLKDATCQNYDAELWFPLSDADSGPATFICQTQCPVRERCLEYAIEAGERFGVWGGLTEKERRTVVGTGMTLAGALTVYGHHPAPATEKPKPRRIADHHDEIVRRRVEGKQTWGQIAAAIGFSAGSLKEYGRRHLTAARAAA